jgi:hypothetical protein
VILAKRAKEEGLSDDKVLEYRYLWFFRVMSRWACVKKDIALH